MASNAKPYPKMQPGRGRGQHMIKSGELFEFNNGEQVNARDYYISCVRRSDYTGVSREWLQKLIKMKEKCVVCGDYGRDCPTCYPLKGPEKHHKWRASKSHLKKNLSRDLSDD
jgi:hypothetical protein